MPVWTIATTSRYERNYKWYEKKRPNELKAVLDNLDTYFKCLNTLGNPLLIKTGFIHHEPKGIKAIDQKGGGQKVKLKQTRLYLYPYCEKNILYLLAIGDKTAQNNDICFMKSKQ